MKKVMYSILKCNDTSNFGESTSIVKADKESAIEAAKELLAADGDAIICSSINIEVRPKFFYVVKPVNVIVND